MSDGTGFKVTDTPVGWNSTDFEDIFVRKDCFLESGLWLWGFGTGGMLGNNLNLARSSPVQTISGGTNWRSVSVDQHSAAIKTDGTLWLWGYGTGGRLGNSTAVNKSSPVQTISGGNNWRSVSVACNHSAAIKTDGTLWAWGCALNAGLGDNSTINKSSPVQTVSGGTDWRSVSLSGTGAASIKTDGSLWLWGSGAYGMLGNNCTTRRSSPVQTISGGTNWYAVSRGEAHTAAIKTDGTLWTWGYNFFGQLGNGLITQRSSPVQTISGGTNWRSVSVTRGGLALTAAIKTDGSLWLWGLGNYGRLGNNVNPVISRSSPVQTISGGTNWRSVSVGSFEVSAIKTDGTLWLWGSGSGGMLGNASTSNRSSPVQTISGGTNWRTASQGSYAAAATREDCW